MLPVRYRSSAGTPLISVTQVLTVAGRIDAQWFTPESAERGTIVHRICEQLDRGGDVDDIPRGLEGYIEAYEKFRLTVRPTYLDIECGVSDDDEECAGRVDRVCEDLFDTAGILDLKTGPPSEWHGQQLAAYNWMRPTGARWGLYLRKNGTYALKQYDDPMDLRKFRYDLAFTKGRVYADGDYWML